VGTSEEISKHVLDGIYLNCINVKEKIKGKGSQMMIGNRNEWD
jgi:hypothetical protein